MRNYFMKEDKKKKEVKCGELWQGESLYIRKVDAKNKKFTKVELGAMNALKAKERALKQSSVQKLYPAQFERWTIVEGKINPD